MRHMGAAFVVVAAILGTAPVANMQAPPGASQEPGVQQPAVITGDPAKGAALLAGAREALGGGDKLSAIKTLQVRGDFRRAAGNNQIEGELELFVERPDKIKRVEDTSQPGSGPAITSTQALNGNEVWDESTGGAGAFGGGLGAFGAGRGGGRGGFGGGGFGGGGFGGTGRQPGGGAATTAPQGDTPQGRGNIDPERLRQALLRQRQMELSRLLLAWLLASDAPVTWIGTAESPDGKANVLEFRPADGTPSTRLFLDSSSNMPLMITWQGAAAGAGRRGGGRRGDAGQGGGAAALPPQATPNQPVTQRMTMGDYKAVDGVRLPHSITRGIGGQTIEEWSISSYRLNLTFRPNTFEQNR